MNNRRSGILRYGAGMALVLLPAGRIDAQAGVKRADTAYARAVAQGDVYTTASGARLTALVDARTLGGPEAEIAEIVIPPGSGAPHRHGAVEIIYVLYGELTHVVNDTAYVLNPGMIGIVRPGDTVVHRVTGNAPARLLVIWPGAGEMARIVSSPAFTKVSPR
jgi:quercetin dioxygenase-like cupin family protein